MQGELVKQGLEKDNLKGVEDHANGVMEKGIENLVTELLTEFHKSDDQARKNELSIELKYALKKLANRVDRGFNIEVRMTEPESTDSEASELESQVFNSSKKHYERIAGASKTLQFLKLEGEPILSLSEDRGEGDKKGL